MVVCLPGWFILWYEVAIVYELHLLVGVFIRYLYLGLRFSCLGFTLAF